MFRIAMVSITVLLFLAGTANATIEPGDGLIIFNGGYATGKAAISGSTLDGPIVSFGYEKLGWNNSVAFFLSVGWSEISRDETVGSSSITRQTETWPFYLGGKRYFGRGRFQGNLGVGLGMYFTTVETAVTQTGERGVRKRYPALVQSWGRYQTVTGY